MDKKSLGIIIIVLVLAIIGVLAFFFLKPSSKPVVEPTSQTENSETIKKVDLKTQPEWVQKLTVSAKKGRSPNGLSNFTISVTGIEADNLTYVVQYQTTNKGVQGALAMSPQSVKNKAFTKVIDLGTCSTKSCVRHDGVTSIDVELDFSDSSVWTGSVELE